MWRQVTTSAVGLLVVALPAVGLLVVWPALRISDLAPPLSAGAPPARAPRCAPVLPTNSSCAVRAHDQDPNGAADGSQPGTGRPQAMWAARPATRAPHPR